MRHLPRTFLLGSIGLLAWTAQPASAAAFGGYASPLGWFTALAALLLIPGWSGHLPGMALVTAGGGLVVAIGAAWLLRWQVSGRALALRGIPRARHRAVDTVGTRPSLAADLPLGWDRERLLADLRARFIELQAAWDSGDTAKLTAWIVPDLLTEFLHTEQAHLGAPGSKTEIVDVRADLLGFERWAQAHVVCVEFSGLLRDAGHQRPIPFREMWLLTGAGDRAEGWQLARHQALL